MNLLTNRKRKLVPENKCTAFKSEIIPKKEKFEVIPKKEKQGIRPFKYGVIPKKEKQEIRPIKSEVIPKKEKQEIRLIKSEVIPKKEKQDSKKFAIKNEVGAFESGPSAKKRKSRNNRRRSCRPRLFRRRRKRNRIIGWCRLVSRKLFYVHVDDCEELIAVFKSVPSGFEDRGTKKWTFPIQDHDKLFSLLIPLQPKIFIHPLPWYIFPIFQQAEESKSIDDCEFDLSHMDQVLVNALFPFQKTGLYFGIQHGGKILLADDMGLGKTIQAIAIANYFKEDWPLLVVSPSSVKYSWLEAFQRWLPSLDGSEINVINSGRDVIDDHKVVIVSYDLLRKVEADIRNKKFKSVIFDESHYLKNIETLRTKAAQTVMKNMSRIIMLSGTPALSRPIELYAQLSALCPQYFNSYTDYGIRYCRVRRTRRGFDVSGSSNTEELKFLLEDLVMIRRKKSDVLSQLPSKCRQIIVLDPAQLNFAEKNKRLSPDLPVAKGSKSTLPQYFYRTGLVKIPAVCKHITNLLSTDRKFLCFAHHQSVIDSICSCIEEQKINYIRIDGAVSAELRKALCDHFQSTDTCKVAVMSITAASCGITLTAADLVVFAELYWNPGTLIQAEDRAHRIGQESSILIQYLIAKRTADDYMWPLIKRKLVTLDKVGLNSKDNLASTDEILMDEINRCITDDALFKDLEYSDLDDFDITLC